MSISRPFRFAVQTAPTTSRAEWVTSVRRAEDLGYSAINVGLHVDSFAHVVARLAGT